MSKRKPASGTDAHGVSRADIPQTRARASPPTLPRSTATPQDAAPGAAPTPSISDGQSQPVRVDEELFLSPAMDAAAQQAWFRVMQWAVLAVKAYPRNTLLAWRGDWRCFVLFCTHTDRVPFPADAETVGAFIAERARLGKRASGIERAKSSIATVHRAAELPNPCNTEPVRLALKAMRGERPTRPRQARGMVWTEMERALKTGPRQRRDRPPRQNYSLRELRDRALMVIAYDTLAREAELVALWREDFDLSAEDGSGAVLIQRAKNDQRGHGRVAPLAPLTAELLRQWLKASQLTTGPLFRRIHGMDRIGEVLQPRVVAQILQKMSRKAGLPREAWSRVTGHSARVGAAQDLAAANVELPAIMQAGGWRDARQVVRYTERQDARRSAMARLARSQGRWPTGNSDL